MGSDGGRRQGFTFPFASFFVLLVGVRWFLLPLASFVAAFLALRKRQEQEQIEKSKSDADTIQNFYQHKFGQA